MKFYAKEIPLSPVFIGGFPLKFEVLATEDSALITELDKCVTRGVGGVIALTKEQYDEAIKKKENETPSSLSSRPPRWRTELSALPSGAQRAVEAAVKNGAHGGDGGQFAHPQIGGRFERAVLPTSGRPVPDPIEVPSAEAFSGVFMKMPPVVKASEIPK